VFAQFVAVTEIDCTNTLFKIAKNKEYNTVGTMTHRQQYVHVRVFVCVEGGVWWGGCCTGNSRMACV